MLRFLIGLLTGIILAIAAPIVAVGGGFVNMSAAEGPGILEQTFGHLAFRRWVQTAAPEVGNPAPPTTETWLAGYAHYKDTCVHCHGAPGVEPSEWAKHMVPNPPDLSHANDEYTEAELFLVVHEGVRMTGMPAFGASHSDEEIWHLVRFVRDIEHLDEARKAELREVTRGGHEHEAPHPGT